MKIWKWSLGALGSYVIEMPTGVRLLHVGLDPTGKPCVWGLFESGPGRPCLRRIAILGTGQAFPEDMSANNYVGTFTAFGRLVCHVFDLGEWPAEDD